MKHTISQLPPFADIDYCGGEADFLGEGERVLLAEGEGAEGA
jgi:hypothetical protein